MRHATNDIHQNVEQEELNLASETQFPGLTATQSAAPISICPGHKSVTSSTDGNAEYDDDMDTKGVKKTQILPE